MRRSAKPHMNIFRLIFPIFLCSEYRQYYHQVLLSDLRLPRGAGRVFDGAADNSVAHMLLSACCRLRPICPLHRWRFPADPVC